MRLMLRSGLLLFAMLAASSLCAATLSGELIDTFCYAHARVAGEAHAACALKCVRAGVPMALLENGTRRVLVLLPDKDASALPPGLVALVGHRVTIDGDLVVTNGTTFLLVKSFKPSPKYPIR
jgi:hypothetical protein